MSAPNSTHHHTPTTMPQHEYTYDLQHILIQIIGDHDAKVLQEKEQTYKGSWRKRGGVGALMMLARKWDRLSEICDQYGGDIFAAWEQTLAAGEAALSEQVADLRRYLFLVEAFMTHRTLNPYNLQVLIEEFNKPSPPPHADEIVKPSQEATRGSWSEHTPMGTTVEALKARDKQDWDAVTRARTEAMLDNMSKMCGTSLEAVEQLPDPPKIAHPIARAGAIVKKAQKAYWDRVETEKLAAEAGIDISPKEPSHAVETDPRVLCNADFITDTIQPVVGHYYLSKSYGDVAIGCIDVGDGFALFVDQSGRVIRLPFTDLKLVAVSNLR